MASLDLPRPSVSDAVAGASVAVVLIPQSLAYAELAGLPPFVGLFASAFPLLVFSLFASSPFLQTGPTAVVSLLTFAALPDVDIDELPALAALLAALVGIFRLVIGATRMGGLVRLISLPVVTGFTSGAAVLIVASQLPRALGLASDDDAGVLREAVNALGSPSDWQPSSIVLSLVTIACFMGGRILRSMGALPKRARILASPLFPGVLLAVVATLAWSQITNYDGATIGDIPEGLPPFSVDLPWGELSQLVVGALVISLIGFAEPVSIARTFANETGQTWNANREFMASGAANIMSAVAGGYPVGGSFSRSSINKLAGAQTRWAGAVTGLIVLAFLPIAGVLEPLPTAVLGAIVLGAASTLIKPLRLVRVVGRSRTEGAIALATFGSTLAFAPRVERAVLLGIVLTGVAHLVRRLEMPTEHHGHDVTVRPTGLLWIGSDATFAQGLASAADDTEGRVTVDLAGTAFIDDGPISAMREVSERLAAQGRVLDWTDVPPGAEPMLAQLEAAPGR